MVCSRARILALAAQMSRVVSDPAFQEALARFQADIVELTSLYEESPVAFVIERLDLVLGSRLLRADPAERDALMLALFEQALLDQARLAKVERAVRRAPMLQNPQRQDLLVGLGMLRRRSIPAPASRLLLSGYEGALWLWARDQQIIDDKRKMSKRTEGKPGYATGVNRILDEDGLPMPDEHRRFVRQRVFDHLANDVRHGRATVAHRECALVVLFALDAWLDDHLGSRLREDASHRINSLFTSATGGPDG
jgi:hypothetical protein